MKHFSKALSFVLLAVIAAGENGFARITDGSPLDVYAALKNLRFDAARVYEVEDLAFNKDRARFVLTKGKLYLSEPVAGRVTGAVFLGDGRFQLTPPNAIERAQVRRFLDKDSLNETFSAAYFRFTDETLEGALADLRPIREDSPDKVGELHAEISKQLLEERRYNLASRTARDFFDPTKDGFFLAVLEHQPRALVLPNYFIFAFDPQMREEVVAYRFYANRAKKPFYTLCSFHRASDYRNGALLHLDEPGKDAIRVHDYILHVKLSTGSDIEAKAELHYVALKEPVRFVTFDLFHELTVDSVKDAAGASLPFIQEEKESGFSVILNDPPTLSAEDTLQVYYHGEALAEPRHGNFSLKDKSHWYPRYGYLVPATYDLTLEYPTRSTAVAVGHRVAYNEENGRVRARWKLNVPSLAAAFAYGAFDSTSLRTHDAKPLRVFSTKRQRGSTRERIAGDVANSLYLFEHLLGGYPHGHLDVVESAGLASHGYPGLLFLSRTDFETQLEGVNEALRGHEVAHQWWGNLVGWESYHDQWLSEGFAEYFGALVVQFLLDDDKTFFEILDGWKTDLLERGHIGVSVGLRRFGFSKSDLSKSDGLDAGPIWLGSRLGDRYPIDYYLITYEKGAYVLHMLRTLLRDFETESDARFWAMLRDFVHTYKGKCADTQDFKRVVEEHLQQDMTWFFDQWVYGTGVPTYIYTSDIDATESGFWVDMRVRQEEVSPAFKMPIPIGIEFETGEKRVERIVMQGNEKRFRLGPFKQRPVEVIFNDYDGVLARVKKE